MRIFKRAPDPFAQPYQQEFQKVYGKARMKATILQARQNAMAQAKTDATRRINPRGGIGVRAILQQTGTFAQGWAANIDAQEKKGMGLGCGAGMGVYGSGRTYGKRRR